MAEASWLQIGILMLVLIVFTFFYEIVVENLYKLFLKYHIPPLFLGAVFKELTMLGLISFLLLFIENSSIVNTDLLHHIHLALFMIAIFYITIIALLLFQSVLWSNYLKYLEKSHSDMGKKTLFRTIFGKLSNSYVNYTSYHALRKDFVQFNKLEENFTFYKYVRSSTQQTILQTIQLDAKIWLTLEVIICVCFVLDLILGRFELSDIVYIISIVEWILAILSVAMMIKIREIVKKLSVYETPEDAQVWKKQKRSFIDQKRKTFCPCTLPPASYISGLFWWNSKGLFRRLIQIILLYQSLCITIIILSSAETFTDSIIFAIILYSLSIIPLIWILFFALPFLVPIYSMIAFTSQYSSRTLINNVLRGKQQHEKQFGRLVDEEDEEEADAELVDLYIPPTIGRGSLTKPLLSEQNPV